MKKILRIVCPVVLTLALVVAMAPVGGVAKAAFNDFSVAGSVALPANKIISAPEGQNLKINFGTTYDYQTYHYIKIKPSKTGYINFANDYTHSYVDLCNANKKVLSQEGKYSDFYSAGSPYKWQTYLRYGVKKNVTYLIRIKGMSTERTSYDQPYIGNLKWTSHAVKVGKFGKSKKKAKAIKRKKVRNGLFVAGDRKARWYKIKTNKKKIKIYFKSNATNGTLYAKVYYKSYRKWFNVRYAIFRSDAKKTLKGTSTRKKNTYYIKVYPKGQASGHFSLKWK